MLIGILAFQGDYYLHNKMFNLLDVNTLYVNDVISLNRTDALVIPGGESSVISKFLKKNNLDKEIIQYSKTKNIFGTCAGAIIMSSLCDDRKVSKLGILNIKSLRNKWGRQIDSYSSNKK